MVDFAATGLNPAGQWAASARGYVTPTAVQLAAIPAILEGRDVWACAQTGSGKTAAFALPIIERCAAVAAGHPLQALVLVPTRELAAQIAATFDDFARFAKRKVKVVTAVGGVSINPQMMALRGGADVVIATPGRFLDLLSNNAIKPHQLNTLVLDEADRLFDLGFAEELAQILGGLPAKRQNLLFSATFPTEVHSLAERALHHPLRIDVPDSAETTPRIEQRSIRVDTANRTQLLRHLIEQHRWSRTLVFTATRYSTEHVSMKLRRVGFTAAALHGELSQSARTKALAEFKAGELQVLLATDLAARGIDILDLPAVVNYDLPRSTRDYVHRIGRTGRAGHAGVAVSFVTAETEAHFRLIEKRHAMRLEREVIAGFEPSAIDVKPSPSDKGQ